MRVFTANRCKIASFRQISTANPCKIAVFRESQAALSRELYRVSKQKSHDFTLFRRLESAAPLSEPIQSVRKPPRRSQSRLTRISANFSRNSEILRVFNANPCKIAVFRESQAAISRELYRVSKRKSHDFTLFRRSKSVAPLAEPI